MWCRLLPLLLFLWMVFSTYWYVCEIRHNNLCFCPKTTATTPDSNYAQGFVLKDGDKVLFQSDKNFHFNKSSNTPEVAGELTKGFEVLSAFLKKNPDKTIQVTGLYSSDEKNTTQAKNLGFARADEIKKLLVAAGIPAAQIATHSVLDNNLPFTNNKLFGGINFDVLGGLAIKDGDKVILDLKDNFSFPKSSSTPEWGGSLKNDLKGLVDYCKNNPGKKLRVEGVYSSIEKNDSKFPNLGLARAEEIKKWLVSNGVPADQVLTVARKEDNLAFPNDKLSGGINLGVIDGAPHLLVKDGDKVILDLKDNFSFPKSSSTPEWGGSLKNDLKGLVDYCKNNPGKKLRVEGVYSSIEKNDSKYPNLGLARAEEIKKWLVSSGVPAGQVLTVARKDDKLAFPNDKLSGGINLSVIDGAPHLIVKDGDTVVLDAPDNFTFPVSTVMPNIPAPVQKGMTTIANYLKGKPDRQLQVIGYYNESEKNPSSFANLGLARADILKQKLVAAGIPADRIFTSARINKNEYPFFDNTLWGGADLNISAPVSDETAKNLKIEPRTLYFNTNESSITLDEALKKYLLEVESYMQQVKTAKVVLTGHTDNRGTEAANMALGKRRAEIVRQELVKFGIDAKRISSSSKGESEPVTTANNEEGWRKNRRVEIIIQ